MLPWLRYDRARRRYRRVEDQRLLGESLRWLAEREQSRWGRKMAALQLSGLKNFFANDGEGIGALLQVVGTLYSVLYAFATYVIWGQFTAVESEIRKESGSLKDLLLFSNRMKPNTREPICAGGEVIRASGGGWRVAGAVES